ncbi:hypothetical protein DPMN_109814 [Dreissena polymorpha]|uniref:Uncharacterized protein n=1 Tax=Dreissena polymorpha TaxID=45954 RepID=A0A9D4QMJ0_DREPO|nr:hypothetical protein DPMN_109814 [Dreissena polymorpha]
MIADNSARLGLTINKGKGKVFRTNASNNTPITVQGETLEEVDSFTCLSRQHFGQPGRNGCRCQNPHR